MWNKFLYWLRTYRCECGNKLYDKNTYEDNYYYLDDSSGLVTEYDIKCKKCHKVVGHWAYGYEEPHVDRFEEVYMRLDSLRLKIRRIFGKDKNSFYDGREF